MKIGALAKSGLMKKPTFVPKSAMMNGDQITEKNLVTNHMEAKEIEFKPIPVRGMTPIIIDYCNYKITILMHNGVSIKFFKLHENRWYKLKETNYDYFQIDECIAWAKSAIDNDTTGYFESLLQKQLKLKH